MKLFYYQRPDQASNFGDALNPWLWHQLLPDVFNDNEATTFFGIGTLLNNLLPHRAPKARHIVVFSSGVGYESGLPAIDASRWTIYCVRGPLSAQKLGLSPQLAVADGGILVRRLFQATGTKVSNFSFMPHVHHANDGDIVWQKICKQTGFRYIDPRCPVEEVLSAISQTKVLLAEAMHGAIVADALRVPWIPVRTSARILTFKWQDWCASIGVKYQPAYILPLIAGYPPLARGVRSTGRVTLHWLNWLRQGQFSLAQNEWQNRQELIAQQLLQIAQTANPILSSDERIEQLTEQLELRIQQFKLDLATPKFP
ncbi:MAG: polysaccharide pyruvyl transferase family protein [Cyanothece sp. SIO1E1]|nr:polysaccharide pyruvyl transferase family protein [Cyanothece sp. SIO1E1]